MLRKDFLWGGAVTAHQSEGGYTEGGKVPAVCDLTVTGKFSDFKDGIDAYHRYKEDFDLYKELGFNAYRFSLDWSDLWVMRIRIMKEVLLSMMNLLMNY